MEKYQEPYREGPERKESKEEAWKDSLLRRTSNQAATDYMERRWRGSRALQWDFEMTRRTLMEELDPGQGERILEIGCGPGTWTREVAIRCREVMAVDISERMIAQARRYTAGLPALYVHSEFLAAPLEGKWDKLFSARAIEYIPDKGLLGQKIAGLLCPGGRAVLITKTRFSLWRGRMRLVYNPLYRRFYERQMPRTGGRDTVSQYLVSPGQLASAFAPHGLALVKVRPVVIRLPLFRNGFHEFPLIPEALESPFLRLSTLLYNWGSSVGMRSAWAPLLLSESYCMTLQQIGDHK